jgi:sigma-B regulation protein RsbU (phosphoserine phosphatase)
MEAKSLQNSLILVVDDMEFNQQFLGKALRDEKFNNLVFASNGHEALRVMEERRPDLVVLDLIMPIMDGFDCCRAIRANGAMTDIPVLVQTALTEHEQCLAAFSAGATDFVSKPIIPEELCARVRVHLERQQMLNDLRRYRSRMAEELEGARILQESTLPHRKQIDYLEKQYGLKIACYFETSSEVGGDFWGASALYPNQMALWMADFSGHGVAAALNAFRLHAYMENNNEYSSHPEEYFNHINEKLLTHSLRGQFATMFYGVLDITGSQIIYAASGCPQPFLIKANGDVLQLPTAGIPLGISINNYLRRTTKFEPGDTLILYSDALTETPNAEHQFLSDEHFIECLKRWAKMDIHQLLENLITEIKAHAAKPLTDDLTINIYRRV